MNYLAHAFLTQNPTDVMIGNIFGDFVRGSDLSAYPKSIQTGIILHRKIDMFTDNHQLTHDSKQLFGPQFRLISSIMIDIFYDHFLAKHWLKYSDQKLEDFTRSVYHHLKAHHDILPDRLKSILPYMITGDWLSSYRYLDNVDQALHGVERRLKRNTALPDGINALKDNYEQLESNFFTFFEDLMGHVSQLEKEFKII